MAEKRSREQGAGLIDVRKAATSALEYFRALSAESPPENVTLEEAELTEDERYWLITLGYDQSSPNPFGPISRRYKQFKVESATGRVLAMKIRSIK